MESPGSQCACAAAEPRPLRRSAANGSWRAGGVVVTCGRGCSGGGPAPRRGGRFIALCAAPARAPLRHRAVPILGHRAGGQGGGTRPGGVPASGGILGHRAVGKTSLAHQFVEGKFLECYGPAVESTSNKVVGDKDEFQLQLVDTARQDEYSILPHSFVISIHGYVLVYSVTSVWSFQVVRTLHEKLMPVVLLGNKADLALQSREVRTDEGKKLVESWGSVFLESSAKESQVTTGIFMKLLEEIERVDNSYSRSTSCCLM